MGFSVEYLIVINYHTGEGHWSSPLFSFVQGLFFPHVSVTVCTRDGSSITYDLVLGQELRAWSGGVRDVGLRQYLLVPGGACFWELLEEIRSTWRMTRYGLLMAAMGRQHGYYCTDVPLALLGASLPTFAVTTWELARLVREHPDFVDETWEKQLKWTILNSM